MRQLTFETFVRRRRERPRLRRSAGTQLAAVAGARYAHVAALEIKSERHDVPAAIGRGIGSRASGRLTEHPTGWRDHLARITSSVARCLKTSPRLPRVGAGPSPPDHA